MPVEPSPRSSPWILAVLVGLVALVTLGWNLPSQSFFADESAYFSQSYFTQLLVNGRRHDRAWLEYAAYDLPPLPKYLIGAALWTGGYKLPGPAEARSWYGNTMSRYDAPGALTTARIPFVALGAIGCVALYGIGVLASGRAVGLLAALLLMCNPLYRMLSRQAMSDVACDSMMLVGLFLGLLTWSRCLAGRSGRIVTLSALAAGLGVGLAMLSKLSGTLALMVIAAWVVLAFATGVSVRRSLALSAAALITAIVSGATFVALDPYLTAHPSGPPSAPIAAMESLSFTDRVVHMFRLRFQVSADQKVMFPHNALNTLPDKLSVSLVQGYGRFGPFGPAASDSTRRFDPEQDYGVVVWFPLVMAGVGWAAAKGQSQRRLGEPPTAWAVLTQFALAFAVVTIYLPMAWDRYLLPIQGPSALLAAGFVVATVQGLHRWLVAPGPGVAD